MINLWHIHPIYTIKFVNLELCNVKNNNKY